MKSESFLPYSSQSSLVVPSPPCTQTTPPCEHYCWIQTRGWLWMSCDGRLRLRLSLQTNPTVNWQLSSAWTFHSRILLPSRSLRAKHLGLRVWPISPARFSGHPQQPATSCGHSLLSRAKDSLSQTDWANRANLLRASQSTSILTKWPRAWRSIDDESVTRTVLAKATIPEAETLSLDDHCRQVTRIDSSGFISSHCLGVRTRRKTVMLNTYVCHGRT